MRYLTASQCRAARALLNWSQPDLSKHCGVNVQTICAFEKDSNTPTKRTLEKITSSLEMSGVIFTEDEGVKLNKSGQFVYEGREGFEKFMEDVYDVARTQGGKICIHNSRPDNWIKWLSAEWNEMHTQRMQALKGKFTQQITTSIGEYNFISRHAEYRWIPKEMSNDQSFYAYGDRIALMNFDDNNVHIVVMHNRKLADGFRSLFDVTWKNVTIVPTPKKR